MGTIRPSLPTINVLSDYEVYLLQSLLDKARRQVVNTQNRPARVSSQVELFPEIYIARTPTAGVPKYTLSTTGTGELPTLNSAECEVWKIDENDQLEQVVNFSKKVYSFYDFDIPGDTWVLIKREKYGMWMIEWFDQGDDLDTGTGTGSGTSGFCQPIIIYERKLECEFTGTASCGGLVGTAEGSGNLNEYIREVHIDVDDGGCLQRTIYGWTFTRTIACCDPSCACETGTSGEGESEVGCCPNPIPNTLTGTFNGGTGDCNCGDGTEVTLVWDMDNNNWTGDTTFCGNAITVKLNCTVDNTTFDGTVTGDCSTSGNTSPTSCDPFLISLTMPFSGDCCNGNSTLTVSE